MAGSAKLEAKEPAALSRLFWSLAFVAVALWGVWLRLRGLNSRGLEYDEIWTFYHYVVKSAGVIFSDLATPNNHPLHSYLCKLSVSTFGETFRALRFPAFFAGLLIPPFAAFLAWRLLKDKAAAFLVFAVCSFNGALIHYSQTARGYSLQTLFVLCAALALFSPREGAARFIAAFAFLVSGVAAVLTISSGIVFAAPLFALWLLLSCDFKKLRTWMAGELPALVSFCLFCVFCLLWFGLNYSQFKAGQSFGESVSTAPLFFDFVQTRLGALAGFLSFFLLIPLFAKSTRRVGALCAGLVAAALLSALATKAGPSRVYLPLIPFIALSLGASLTLVKAGSAERFKPLFCALLASALACAAPSSLAKWTPVDWNVAYPLVENAFPDDVYICFDSYETPSILFNCKNSFPVERNAKRISAFDGRCALVGAERGVRAVALDTKGSVYIPVPSALRQENIAGLPVWLCKFVPVSSDSNLDGALVAAFVGPCSPEASMRLFYGFFKPNRWLLLNNSLRSVPELQKSDAKVADVFVSTRCDFPAKGLCELSALSGGAVRFFILEGSK